MSGILSGSKFSVTKVRRLVLLVTAFIITVSTISPLVDYTAQAKTDDPGSSATASAKFSDMSLDDQGKSGSYYLTLQGCISNNMPQTINADGPYYDPTQINWFDDNQAWGYIYKEGKTDCKIVMSKALDLWNLEPATFLKGIGFTQKSSTNYTWTTSKDGAARKTAFMNYVKSSAVLSTSDPGEVSKAAAYKRYDYWWDNNCVVTAYGKFDNIKDTKLLNRIKAEQVDPVSKEVGVRVIDSGGKPVTQKYGTIIRTKGIKYAYLYYFEAKKPAAGNTPFEFVAYGYHQNPNPRSVSCVDVKSALAKYAPDYEAYLNKKALTTICQSKGYTAETSGQAALDACVNGYGKGPECGITYAGKADLIAACQAGAGILPEELAAGIAAASAEEAVDKDSDGGGDGTGCGVDGVGWIVCPLVNFMGSMLDQIFKGIADNFLKTDVKLFSTDSGTYVGWGVFRSIANVAFVIVFLIIIFSQLTSVGVSNYGVKKMLPRLVIAAILVNISFFVCQLAVDLSNVLGYSAKSLFDGIANTATVPTSTDASANGFGIAGIVTAVLGAAVISYFALGTLIPILIGALVAVVMIILILIMRKALIVLLIVVSPLAFVAFLLPNTEALFTRWRKAFVALLLVFPIVSVVFGASSLASQILLGTDPSNISIQIAAVGAASLPFFIVPGLLKGSIDAIGSAGGKLSGFGSKLGGSAGKGVMNTRLGKGAEYLAQERKTRNALIQSGQFKTDSKSPLNRFRSLRSGVNSGINSKLGTFGTRLQAGGVSLAADQIQKDTKAAAILLGTTPERGAVRKALESKDPAMRRAAVERMVSTNDVHGINSMVNAAHTWTPEQRTHLADTLAASSSRPAYLGQGDLANVREGNQVTVEGVGGLIQAAVEKNAYSPAKLATADSDELMLVADEVVKIGGGTLEKISGAAQGALEDERIAPTIGKGMQQITNLARKEAPDQTKVAELKK